MSLFTRVVRGRLAAWLTLAAALVVGVVAFGLPKPDNPAPVSDTGLSVEWQSTQVERLQEQLPSKDAQTALVVVSRADRAPLSGADRSVLDGLGGELSSLAAGGRVSPPRSPRTALWRWSRCRCPPRAARRRWSTRWRSSARPSVTCPAS